MAFFAERTHAPLVVLVTTKTEEKLVHLNYSAKVNKYPIFFIGLNEIQDSFSSALEDTGCSYFNAEQKHSCTIDAFARLQEEGPSREALKAKIKSLGVSFDPERILYASEDSTIYFPSKVWTLMRKMLKPYVSTELLDRAEGNRGDPGPGAETGPILGAVGIPRFMDMLYQAGKVAGYKDSLTGIIDQVDFLFRRLSDLPQAPLEHMSFSTQLCLSEEGYRKGKQKNPQDTLFLTGDFFSHASLPDIPIVECVEEYLKTDAPRAQITHGLAEKFNIVSSKVHKSPILLRREKAEIVRKRIDLTPPTALLEGSIPAEAWYQYLNLTPVLESADAYIFGSFDPRNLVQKRWAYYILNSAIVLAQTEASQAGKRIIVENDNGCWDDAKKIEWALSNAGMSKNFIRLDSFEKGALRTVLPSGVNHVASAYVDYLTGSKANFQKAENEILFRHSKNYHRFQSSGLLNNTVQYGGSWPVIPPLGVAVYTSAGNDNLKLLRQNHALGKFLAESNHSLVFGGGDLHAMRSVYEGCYKNKGRVASFSTPSIVKNETHCGCLPESTYWGLTENIFARQTHFLDLALVHNVTGGGMGTFLEQLNFAVTHDAFSGFRHRNMIVDASSLYGKGGAPNPLANPGLDILYGSEAVRALSKNPEGLASHGVYVSNSLYQTKKLIGSFDRGFMAGPRPMWAGPQPIVKNQISHKLSLA